MEIQVTVNNVKIVKKSVLNENEYNIHEFEFDFVEEYNGLTKKAVFTRDDGEAYLETIIDNKCSIPSEVLENKNQYVQIGVYAYDLENEDLVLRYSPQPTQFFVNEGSYKEAQNSTPPTPSEIEQLQAQITQNANDIDTLETDVGNIQSDITDIKAEQITQNTNIQTNADNITNLQNTKADKAEIPTKTSELINDSGFIEDTNYVHTDNNFTNEDKSQIQTNKDDIVEINQTIDAINTDIGEINQDIQDLETNKADKIEIPTKTSDLTNDSGFINKNVNDLVNYTLKTNTGSLIDLEINSTTYVITLSLKDVDGTVISTDTIDLPLESVVVGGSYDAVNKKIVLTLENGNTVDIPVGDLIAGLQTEITSQNKLASDLVDDTNSGNKFVTTSEKQAWNAKYDKPVGGIPSTDLASDVLADYVKNTDYATNQKGGVIKVTQGNGIEMGGSGNLIGHGFTYDDYSGIPAYALIAKSTLENVIKGKELVNKTYVDNIVGDIESILEELDIGGGVV